MLRKATPIDWVGDPIDIQNFTAGHGERNFDEMLAHYEEYGDVVGDSFLNLVATTLPLDAYLVTGDAKYKKWIVEYMDAWLERMKQNNGIIPSFVDLDGKIGGPDGKWWGNAYGWGFSPVNPVTGRRENRNRIPRALVGFNNALWVTGDQKYVDAWRTMIDAVNSHALNDAANGRRQYPTMYGPDGWYGWQAQPWNVGALEVWYWSMKPEDLERVPQDPWIAYLQGHNPGYPETALQKDLQSIDTRLAQVRAGQDDGRATAGRQHDGLQPGRGRRADPTDARRPAARAGRRVAECAAALLRSGAQARRASGGRGGAGLGDDGHQHQS